MFLVKFVTIVAVECQFGYTKEATSKDIFKRRHRNRQAFYTFHTRRAIYIGYLKVCQRVSAGKPHLVVRTEGDLSRKAEFIVKGRDWGQLPGQSHPAQLAVSWQQRPGVGAGVESVLCGYGVGVTTGLQRWAQAELPQWWKLFKKIQRQLMRFLPVCGAQ